MNKLCWNLSSLHKILILEKKSEFRVYRPTCQNHCLLNGKNLNYPNCQTPEISVFLNVSKKWIFFFIFTLHISRFSQFLLMTFWKERQFQVRSFWREVLMLNDFTSLLRPISNKKGGSYIFVWIRDSMPGWAVKIRVNI